MFLAGSREQLQALIDANSAGKWGYLLISTFVTLVFMFLAAAPVALFAARVPPVIAIAETGPHLSLPEQVFHVVPGKVASKRFGILNGIMPN